MPSFCIKRILGEMTGEETIVHFFASIMFVAGITLAATPMPLVGQLTSTLVGSGCDDCLRFTPHVTLGDSSEVGAVSVGRGLVQLSNGSFVHADGTGLSRFSRSGEPLGDIGRLGSGPMEFRRLDFVARAPGDTLIVFDLGNGRVTLISPQLQQIKQFTLTNQVTNAVAIAGGKMIANIHFRDPGRMGIPMHVIDGKTGIITSSFGLSSDESFDRNGAWAGFREIAASNRGTVWSSRRNRYLLEEWDLSGKKLRQIERQVQWFRPYERRAQLAPGTAPDPHVERIFVDSKGLIWVFAVVPARNWADAIVARKPMRGFTAGYEPTSLSDLYDTMIEVIDADARRVLVSQRFDGYVWGMLSDSLMYSDAQDKDGFPTLQVWRVDVGGSFASRRQ